MTGFWSKNLWWNRNTKGYELPKSCSFRKDIKWAGMKCAETPKSLLDICEEAQVKYIWNTNYCPINLLYTISMHIHALYVFWANKTSFIQSSWGFELSRSAWILLHQGTSMLILIMQWEHCGIRSCPWRSFGCTMYTFKVLQWYGMKRSWLVHFMQPVLHIFGMRQGDAQVTRLWPAVKIN